MKKMIIILLSAMVIFAGMVAVALTWNVNVICLALIGIIVGGTTIMIMES